MVEIAIGAFTLVVIGSVATSALVLIALSGIAVVEWVKYRRGRNE